MNVLPELVGLMNKEEIRNFKLFAKQTNDSYDRKDILLFDHIKKNYPHSNEEKIIKKLYPNSNKNAFYRLKNRLIEDVVISLSVLHYNTSEINTILNNYLLAKLFIKKNKWKLAIYYLQKAEKKAKQIENVELLDLIYNEFIKLSLEVLDINPEEYISKRKENRIKLITLQEIDDILAVVTYRVKSGQNFGKGNEKINELLSKTVNTFSKNKDIKNSPLLRFKIYDSISRILLQQHNFVALEEYLLKTFKEFSSEKLFTKNNHDTKLQMLTYITNSLAQNKKNEQSLKYVKLLHESMKEYSGLLYDKYLFFYYNMMVNYYAKTDIEQAIQILNEAKEENVIKNHPVYIGFVYLNLAISYFGIKNYKTSLKSIVNLYMLDSFKTLDSAFRFKIAITELIIRYELEDIDFIEQRIIQIKKEFKEEVKSSEFVREVQLMNIILHLIQSTSIKKDKKIQQLVNVFTQKGKNSNNESEIINYNDWLKEKMN